MLDMRPGRLATMRIVWTIERANGRYLPVEYGKSKAAPRTLKMPEFLREMLARHLSEFGSEEWVFSSPGGGFLRYDNFRDRVWLPAVESSGLGALTFHQLRHTAAAFMVDEGADPLQVKRRMGHEDIAPPTTFTATSSPIARKPSWRPLIGAAQKPFQFPGGTKWGPRGLEQL
jgi:integrase